MSKLNLDRDRVEASRHLAAKIARNIQDFIQHHTTVSIERATLRLFGVEEAYKGHPLVNAVMATLSPEEISRGVCYWLARGLAAQRTTPISLCLRVAEGHVRLQDFPEADFDQAREILIPLVQEALHRIDQARQGREKGLDKYPPSPRPLKYLIVATGNIHEDVEQAKAAVRAGADCIAVIRSTAQSLLDFVPSGLTTEGFGGTYATQENFRLMRQAMDEIAEEVGRYIRVVNYSSGLCMSEIAAMAAVERLDYLLNDSMYGILFRDINMKRTLTDQNFSRLIIARAKIVINTGEDNYLTTAESYHAFEMDPTIPDSFLYELAQAQLVREVFPRSPIKYMPPTRHKTGDIFFGHVLDAMFNLVGVITGQEIQLLGMPTEAIHNPLLQDRFMSLKSANYIFSAARSLADELDWSPNGKLARRARSVLDDTHKLLERVAHLGLFKAIEQGLFANMQREIDGGRGLDGLIRKGDHYWNPLEEALEEKMEGETDTRPLRAPPRHRTGRGSRGPVSHRGGGERRRSPRRPSSRRSQSHQRGGPVGEGS